MNFFIINTKSSTQAEKARAFLAKNGIRSVVEKTFGNGGYNGCGFALKIYGERGTVCPLLSKIGISCGS